MGAYTTWTIVRACKSFQSWHRFCPMAGKMSKRSSEPTCGRWAWATASAVWRSQGVCVMSSICGCLRICRLVCRRAVPLEALGCVCLGLGWSTIPYPSRIGNGRPRYTGYLLYQAVQVMGASGSKHLPPNPISIRTGSRTRFSWVVIAICINGPSVVMDESKPVRSIVDNSSWGFCTMITWAAMSACICGGGGVTTWIMTGAPGSDLSGHALRSCSVHCRKSAWRRTGRGCRQMCWPCLYWSTNHVKTRAECAVPASHSLADLIQWKWSSWMFSGAVAMLGADGSKIGASGLNAKPSHLLPDEGIDMPCWSGLSLCGCWRFHRVVDCCISSMASEGFLMGWCEEWCWIWRYLDDQTCCTWYLIPIH